MVMWHIKLKGLTSSPGYNENFYPKIKLVPCDGVKGSISSRAWGFAMARHRMCSNSRLSLLYCLVCSLKPCGHLLGKCSPLCSLVCDVALCLVTFPYCVSGQVRYLIVSIPDFALFLTFLVSLQNMHYIVCICGTICAFAALFVISML